MLLLLLDDENGTFAHVPSWSLNYALGGAVLMDLALENRIDTDLEKLFLVDETPLGDSLVDPMLGEIAGDGKTHDARFWVERAAGRAAEIRETALDRLVNAGILARHDERFLWVFRSRRYPVVDGTGRAGGEAAHHGGAVQRHDPRAPGTSSSSRLPMRAASSSGCCPGAN